VSFSEEYASMATNIEVMFITFVLFTIWQFYILGGVGGQRRLIQTIICLIMNTSSIVYFLINEHGFNKVIFTVWFGAGIFMGSLVILELIFKIDFLGQFLGQVMDYIDTTEQNRKDEKYRIWEEEAAKERAKKLAQQNSINAEELARLQREKQELLQREKQESLQREKIESLPLNKLYRRVSLLPSSVWEKKVIKHDSEEDGHESSTIVITTKIEDGFIVKIERKGDSYHYTENGEYGYNHIGRYYAYINDVVIGDIRKESYKGDGGGRSSSFQYNEGDIIHPGAGEVRIWIYYHKVLYDLDEPIRQQREREKKLQEQKSREVDNLINKW
jgi:hypothetical protein